MPKCSSLGQFWSSLGLRNHPEMYQMTLLTPVGQPSAATKSSGTFLGSYLMPKMFQLGAFLGHVGIT